MRRRRWLVLAVLGVCVLAVISLVGYLSPATEPVLDPLGKWEQLCLYSNEAVQDFTYYGKFSVTDPKPGESACFQPVHENNIRQEFLRHLEDYEGWIGLHSQSDAEKDRILAERYDFDRDIISDADWVAILDDPKYGDLGNYDLYYLDWETGTVYYFHNNI